MKKLKALICKWFGHKWIEVVAPCYTYTGCKRCNALGSCTKTITFKINRDYTDADSQHFKDYLKVLKGGKE